MTTVYASNDGDADAEMQIILTQPQQLAASDFVL